MALIPSQRHLFDIPREIAYFNCAYYSPQLNESRDRLIAGVRAKSQAWTRVPPGFFDDAEAIRAQAARLFGGEAARVPPRRELRPQHRGPGRRAADRERASHPRHR